MNKSKKKTEYDFACNFSFGKSKTNKKIEIKIIQKKLDRNELIKKYFEKKMTDYSDVLYQKNTYLEKKINIQEKDQLNNGFIDDSDNEEFNPINQGFVNEGFDW